MLRFFQTKLENNSNVAISDNSLLMDSKIWQNYRSFMQAFDQKQDHLICLAPVKNASGELLAYGFQDNEANRELRMLRELAENEKALQFTDIFPEYKEVIIWGFNELAFFFVEYLKKLGIAVSVTGRYWDYYGYKSCDPRNLLGGGNNLIVYAEGTPLQNQGLYETIIRSVSPEFECIDKIYEANVLEGRIQDTIGDFDEFIRKLKDEPEIVILGVDREAQDTYDLLMAHDIDICCFAVPEESDGKLLGKQVMSIEDAMQCLERPIFLNYRDIHGALGEEWTEYFDYRGYERNKQYFLVRDYTDIPTSNLIHILHAKNVLLTGDPALCRLLSDYLNLIENNEITVQYIPLFDKVSTEKADILCLVVPDYSYNAGFAIKTEKNGILKQNLSEVGFVGYTDYFVCSRCFALVDLYLNKDTEKYTIPELVPKGIALGRIPAGSGNTLFRGIMDGHPEILIIPYSEFSNNLFFYCIRLANVASDEVLQNFWEIYDAETNDKKERVFPHPEIFEDTAKELLSLKKSFTSQELFVLFHIAYAEMMVSRRVSDISKLTIYWEPHHVDRNEFPFYALWLEDRKVNGNTIALRRNNMVKAGSMYNSGYTRKVSMSRQFAYKCMFVNKLIWDKINLECQYWTEHNKRFEDIKTKPKEKLMEICKILDISWSDNMLWTTIYGKPYSYRSIDFDLKPVFNKYEDYLSEFDRFRISIASSPFQKRYGYSYNNILEFTRRELQELFLKPFKFDKKLQFDEPEHKRDFELYEWLRWQLWDVRKHMVLDDVRPEFDRFELETTIDERINEYIQMEKDKSVEYIISHDKVILYGTGNDCIGLLKLVDKSLKERLLYCDKKAATRPYVFEGKNVIAPKELNSVYAEYNILVTSSLYRRRIEYEFENMGIDSSRVYYNRAEFRADSK